MTKLIYRRLAVSLVSVVSIIALVGPTPSQASDDGFTLVSTIAFTSTRDDPTATTREELFAASEIYLVTALINDDGTINITDPRRLTENTDGDAFANLSPDGKKIVFDSNRDRAEGEALNTSDLFLMNTDGTEQTFLTRGGSPTWSPDGKRITFQASASGTGTPRRLDPGSATTDSDIFVANVDDVLAGVEQRRNITNSVGEIDEDPDWSPDGQKIVFTKHVDSDRPILSNTAEIYVMNPDGTDLQRLTFNAEEERAPDWSPDGTRILFMCRIGGGAATFEICVMNADGTGLMQLTHNSVADLSANWSPDGQHIVFHRPVAGRSQLFVMNADGTGVTQITTTPGLNLIADWGELRVKVVG